MPGAFAAATLRELRSLKRAAERAMAQVSDEQFFAALDPETNSIAVLVKHIAGNMLSRWTDFLSSDGEKPWRDRDAEFRIDPADTRATLLERWEQGWHILLSTLESLGPADLERTVTIRAEPYSVVGATQRSLSHYSDHIGQIILLAKHLAGPNWKTLSIPRGKSQEHNAEFVARQLAKQKQ
ncbi:MAG TPA: DUF1572 family protein [Candidatus Acidoferrales bacterium]|nr:DUF1572 family protein [Candidatus Acidoferrales bacterium]